METIQSIQPNQVLSFSGYASVFNIIDRDGEMITNTAFDSSLESIKGTPLLWQHDTLTPIGKIEKATKNTTGLFVTASINQNIIHSPEIINLIMSGTVKGLSVGYIPHKTSTDNQGTKIIHDAELLEISVVTIPSNSLSTIKFMSLNDKIILGEIPDNKNNQKIEESMKMYKKIAKQQQKNKLINKRLADILNVNWQLNNILDKQYRHQ